MWPPIWKRGIARATITVWYLTRTASTFATSRPPPILIAGQEWTWEVACLRPM